MNHIAQGTLAVLVLAAVVGLVALFALHERARHIEDASLTQVHF